MLAKLPALTSFIHNPSPSTRGGDKLISLSKSADSGADGHGALPYEPPSPSPDLSASEEDPEHPRQLHRRWLAHQALVFAPGMTEVILELLASPGLRAELRFVPARGLNLYDLQRKYRGDLSHSGSLLDQEAA